MPLRCWYRNSEKGTQIFKGATCYCIRRWCWYPILASSSPSQHTRSERYLSRRNDYTISNANAIQSYKLSVSKTRGATLPYLLFAHAFTGCDMTSTYSAIYLPSKTFIFKKLKRSKRLRNSADISKNGQNPQTIGTAAFIFLSFTLVTSVIRKKIRKKTIW